ncbi:hypothetical protein D3C78_1456860 [compost metagenome]
MVSRQHVARGPVARVCAARELRLELLLVNGAADHVRRGGTLSDFLELRRTVADQFPRDLARGLVIGQRVGV